MRIVARSWAIPRARVVGAALGALLLAMFVGPLGGALGYVPWLAVAAVGLVVGLLATIPSTLEVGEDGVTLRWLGFTRFLPYDALDRFESRGDWLGIVQRTEADTWIAIRDVETTKAKLEAVLAERRRRREEGAVRLPARFAREGRSVTEWLEALRSAATGYRETETPTDLWRVAEDGGAKVQERAAALVALRARLGQEAVGRARIAVSGVVAPRHRVALDSVLSLEPDDAGVAEALEALEEPAGQSSAR